MATKSEQQLRPTDEITKRLRHYLVNWTNRGPICDKVVLDMEQINIVPLLVESSIEDGKLRNILHELAGRLRCLRLQMADIPKLQEVCRRMEVTELTGARVCVVLAGEDGKSEAGASQLELLVALTPAVVMLKVLCSIDGHFPQLKKVRVIYLHGPVAQATLEELLRNCPLLRHLAVHDGSLDIQGIGQCSFLQALALPLLLKSPLAICQLGHLKVLSLQSKDHWQCEDWLLPVQEIILAKRFELERICLDGTYLGAPLNLSALLLDRCTALTEVRLSHCKLVEGSNLPLPLPLPLPLSCQRLSIRSCTLNNLNLLLESDAMLQQMELFSCKFSQGEKILSQALAKRQTQPVMGPVQIKLLQSPQLELEYSKWTAEERLAAKPWLEFEVLKADQIGSLEHQPLGMISMRFGRAIDGGAGFLESGLPNLPDAADLLKEMRSLDLVFDPPSTTPAGGSI